MLSRITLDGFKSFAPGAQAEIWFGPLTLLVGANASGKSNLLDAIRFLAGLGQDLPIGEVLRGRFEGGRQVWGGIRGGASEATFCKGESFQLESWWELGALHCVHSVKVDPHGHPRIVGEYLEEMANNLGRLLDTHAPALRGGVGPTVGGSLPVLAKKEGGGPGRKFEASANRSVLAQAPADQVHPDVIAVARLVRAAMSASTFLDLSPNAMRAYSARSTPKLGDRGENLSAAIWHLCESSDLRQTLVDWISELCAPRITGLDFIQVPETGDLLLVLEEEGGHRTTAQAMSDGTLRFLGLLAAAYSVEPGTTILIEEIENGLHPTRLHLLLELLDQVTRTREIQIIATSHSPFALQALRPEVLAQAVVFGRHPDAQGTVAHALGDLPHFAELVEQRGIEHLFTSGWLERSL